MGWGGGQDRRALYRGEVYKESDSLRLDQQSFPPSGPFDDAFAACPPSQRCRRRTGDQRCEDCMKPHEEVAETRFFTIFIVTLLLHFVTIASFSLAAATVRKT